MAREYQLQLDPHEQLDEVALRTNDDGTVEVEVLEWENTSDYAGNKMATISFRKPDGMVTTEQMKWPEARDESYKFIRFIEESPYTLRTAEQINETDDKIWMGADPTDWTLDLPEDTGVMGRVETPDNSLMWLAKTAFWPITLCLMALSLLKWDAVKGGYGGTSWQKLPFDNKHDVELAQKSIKSGLLVGLWVLFLLALL